jgi:hypothetical protein
MQEIIIMNRIRDRIRSMSFLRVVLAIDAISSLMMGLGLASTAKMLSAFTLLPPDLLFGAGISLLPFAAFVGFLAMRESPSRVAVWVVIAVNALWVVESVTLLVSNWIAPNLLGSIFIAVQAVAVGVFAELQYMGLRKERLVAA